VACGYSYTEIMAVPYLIIARITCDQRVTRDVANFILPNPMIAQFRAIGLMTQAI